MVKVRIQKFLASAGVASRRAVEQAVRAGRVAVNAQTVTELPCFVTAADRITLDGEPVGRRRSGNVYLLLNKPRGVICTQRDETGRGRRRAIDLVGPAPPGVHCVGRLDEQSTGLILLTNDGELTHRLTHARFGVIKTYRARVGGRVAAADVARLAAGIHLDSGRTGGAAVKLLRRGGSESLLQLRISEGRNRQVRRMLARLGHKVRRLHRSAIGTVTDRGLKIGHFRYLRAAELAALRKAAGIAGVGAGLPGRGRNQF